MTTSNKTENFAVTKIKAHEGDIKKQQQVGDNHIYHAHNQHIRYHVAAYMLEAGIPSRYDLESVKENALKAM